MKFHLNYQPPKFDFTINHHSPIFLIGSCFAENMGDYLCDHRFNTTKNPHGILFNPASIALCLDAILEQKVMDEAFVLQRDSLYFSYLHHSSFHSEHKQAFIDRLSELNLESFQALKQSRFLFITFGTAYVYEHSGLKSTVANCHKQAQPLFKKRLLSVTEIVNAYSLLIQKLKTLQPELKIIFTVSPVKYLKDGLEENTLSKSVLRLSIHELMKSHAACFYFPAFEFVNDDLRDYRFYKADLAHPNEVALQYIWEKFSACFFTETTRHLNSKINNLQLALGHKYNTSPTEEQIKHQQYIASLRAEIADLIKN